MSSYELPVNYKTVLVPYTHCVADSCKLRTKTAANTSLTDHIRNKLLRRQMTVWEICRLVASILESAIASFDVPIAVQRVFGGPSDSVQNVMLDDHGNCYVHKDLVARSDDTTAVKLVIDSVFDITSDLDSTWFRNSNLWMVRSLLEEEETLTKMFLHAEDLFQVVSVVRRESQRASVTRDTTEG